MSSRSRSPTWLHVPKPAALPGRYYAIAEFDSASTADQVYGAMDGMQFERSANVLDLRFVPDEQDFAERQVRDSATDIPSDYDAPDFETKARGQGICGGQGSYRRTHVLVSARQALQNTRVELTWDQDDPSRKKALTKRLKSEQELKESDFAAYLASESEEDEDDEGERAPGAKEDAAAIRERYRSLLLGGGSSGPDGEGKPEKKGKKDKGEGDMVVTFDSGLETLGKRLLDKKKEEAKRQGETVWDAYLRRQKEKRAEAKRLGRKAKDSDSDSGDEDGGAEEVCLGFRNRCGLGTGSLMHR